ncbi:MAG TPA: endo-1,4-beta-xylanase [Gemmatimonadaceae bacterium]|nr:endo-1,4-beta-xylanase [Gemmatimonadaceae bacterium]
MSPRCSTIVAALTVFAAMNSGCQTLGARSGAGGPPGTLKEAFKDAFLVGGTLNANQFSGRDTIGANLVKAQFNAVSPENILKWESVHPRLGEYDFSGSDQYVKFGRDNGMFVVGHTLVWHNQTPRWVFESAPGQPVSRDTLIARLRDHIQTVVGRYRGRINGWDVVNEALNEDGTLRQTPWMRIIGDEYLTLAFQFAHQADPDAELYYNDYSLENPAKRAGAVTLVKGLLAKGIPVKAVGLQGHHKMNWPSMAAEDSTIRAFADLGVKVMITELDIDVLPPVTRGTTADVSLSAQGGSATNPYTAGLPDSVQQKLATRYAEFFEVYLKNRDVITRVTFWGVGDGDSWLNDWPARGRTNYPLLFDRNHKPKPAFDSVIAVTKRAGISD